MCLFLETLFYTEYIRSHVYGVLVKECFPLHYTYIKSKAVADQSYLENCLLNPSESLCLG